MNVNTATFSYPNLRFDDQEYAMTVNAPQPLLLRNTLLVNCDASELGLSTTFEDSTKVEGKVVRIFVGPMVETEDSAGRFHHAADAMDIPENEREAHASYIDTLVYFQPVGIILLHHISRTPRVDSTEIIEIHLDASVAVQIDKMYFLLLTVHSPFVPGTLQKLKIHLDGETLVVDLPNGPWFPPSSITTEVKIAADYCYMILPAYDGKLISSLAITDPITPTMLRHSYTAHLNAVLKTLKENEKWLIHLEISLAFSKSLSTILNACASLKHLTSLTITEYDPPFGERFDPDNDFKDRFSRKLQPLIGLKSLTIPYKFRSDFLAHWYPHLNVELVSDRDI